MLKWPSIASPEWSQSIVIIAINLITKLDIINFFLSYFDQGTHGYESNFFKTINPFEYTGVCPK